MALNYASQSVVYAGVSVVRRRSPRRHPVPGDPDPTRWRRRPHRPLTCQNGGPVPVALRTIVPSPGGPASVLSLTARPGGLRSGGQGRMPQATVTAESGPRNPRFPSSKFRAPKLMPGLVRRSRLLDQLDRGDQVRLALVVGPAGAGKTMLVADWLAARPERSSAWLSCDAADADPLRFVAAIIEAARYGFGEPSIGEDARQLMSLDGEVSADAIAALADDLEAPDETRVLVIDDFHLAGAAGAETLRWLVEYHPPSLQLVVASRVDPPLRVHRMRAHQDLVELRDEDLAFSVEETRSLLAGFGVWLAESDLALVHRRS